MKRPVYWTADEEKNILTEGQDASHRLHKFRGPLTAITTHFTS